MFKKYFLISFVLLIAISSFAFAQKLKQGDVLDKIVARVGNEVILQSEVEGSLMQYAMENHLNPKDEKLRKSILDNLINEKLIVQKAIEDSVEVSDDEIKQRWEYFLGTMVSKYGSESRVASVYGMSIARLQYESRDNLKNAILSEKLIRKQFEALKITPHEVEDYFKTLDTVPKIPMQSEIYHIVLNVPENNQGKDEAMKLARKVRDSLLSGVPFYLLAVKYSISPTVVTDSGNLGWRKKGYLFPEYENIAYSLQKGEFSVPVETPYGIHVFEVLGKTNDSVNTRQIIFSMKKSGFLVDSIKNFLITLKKRVIAGEQFEKLAEQYSDEKETAAFSGFVGNISPSEMFGVTVLKTGEISDPLPYDLNTKKPAYHIIFKKREIPEHTATLKDDYKQIENVAKRYKQAKIYNDWIESLRKTLHWKLVD
ncbi:MAG: peptidylprolyl isomerase [Candidatus Kapabacteria bacterium]|nr:peptidylprolyl isomerase [Candidatus Kapabacteria bacterium]